jgi:hypothetical protein
VEWDYFEADEARTGTFKYSLQNARASGKKQTTDAQENISCESLLNWRCSGTGKNGGSHSFYYSMLVIVWGKSYLSLRAYILLYKEHDLSAYK